jgi:hypothetical protein
VSDARNIKIFDNERFICGGSAVGRLREIFNGLFQNFVYNNKSTGNSDSASALDLRQRRFVFAFASGNYAKKSFFIDIIFDFGNAVRSAESLHCHIRRGTDFFRLSAEHDADPGQKRFRQNTQTRRSGKRHVLSKLHQ